MNNNGSDGRQVVDDRFQRFLKGLWSRFSHILLVILVFIAIGYGGWQYWSYQYSLNIQKASVLYTRLQQAHQKESSDQKVIELSDKIMNSHPSTVYAGFASLVLASHYLSAQKPELALNTLKWAVDHDQSSILKTMARIRLAEINLNENNTQKALNYLNKKANVNAFKTKINMLKGDAYQKQTKMDLAQSYWEKAKKIKKANTRFLDRVLTMKIQNASYQKQINNKKNAKDDKQ